MDGSEDRASTMLSAVPFIANNKLTLSDSMAHITRFTQCKHTLPIDVRIFIFVVL